MSIRGLLDSGQPHIGRACLEFQEHQLKVTFDAPFMVERINVGQGRRACGMPDLRCRLRPSRGHRKVPQNAANS